MMIKSTLVLLACCFLHLAWSSLTPNAFIGDEDKARLKALFKLTEPYTDIPLNNLYYSLLGSSILSNDKLFTLLNTQQSNKICDHLKASLTGSADKLDNVYFSSSAAKLLNCQVKTDPKLVAFLEASIKQDATITDLHRAAVSLVNLGKPLDSAKISKLLQAALKKDESLLSVGLAFQLASHLKGPENLTPFVDKIGDVIVQADEVDGRYLQFEGGLGITANVILGIYSLATSAGKPTGLTNEQAIKFTNYFLNRKTVQTIKGGADLLQVLRLLTQNKYHIPVCISLYGSPSLSKANPLVSVHVTNVLGQSLGTGLKVVGESTAWTGTKTFKGVEGDSTLFAIDFMETGPRRGPYSITLSVTPGQPDSRLIGNANAVVKVIVLTTVLVDKAEIGVGDKDQTGSFKMIPLQYPQYSKEILEADQQQKVLMKFALKDQNSQDYMTAHQVFVQLQNEETKHETVYIAEPDGTTSNIYKFDLNLAQRAKDLGFMSGTYHLSLIVGDPVIANPFIWKAVTLKLSFPPGQAKAPEEKAPWMKATYSPKPVINHIFRQQEKRPPAIFSDTFSLLVLVPLLLLFIIWARLRVNLSNFSFSLSAIIFHAGLGSIFLLFTCFWLKLDMFTTIKYLLGLGLITFLSGHSLLSKLANKKPDK